MLILLNAFSVSSDMIVWVSLSIWSNTYMLEGVLSRFSCVQLFVTLWTVACQAPLSMGFSRPEYWSGLPCPPSEVWSRDQTFISYVSCISRQALYHQCHLGSPEYVYWVSNTEPALYSQNRLHLVVLYYFIICCCIQFGNILYFAPIFMRDTGR